MADKGKGGSKGAATKDKTKTKTKSAAATSEKPPKEVKTYAIGAQRDGSVVVRIGNDFDLMIARKALEKQLKNKGAAVGTISALADGEDPFLDAIEQSLQRTLNAINKSRAPDKQIAGTPIGDEIARNASDASTGTHGGTRTWATAIPQPRPAPGDAVEHVDGSIVDIVDALGFKGDGLTGSESEAELQQLADDGKLTGAFEVVAGDAHALVHFHDVGLAVKGDDTRARNIWRVVDGDYRNVDTTSIDTKKKR